MSRGTSLINIRNTVKGFVGDTLNASANQQTNALINRRIVQNQQSLYAEYPWLFAKGSFDVTVGSGTRFVAVPSIDFDSPLRVDNYYNTLWNPVAYGIGPAEYNVWNSETMQTSDPIIKWSIYNGDPPTVGTPVGSTMQIEVWPVPVTVQKLRFTGQRLLSVLPPALTDTSADDALTCDLDDLLLALWTALDFRAGESDAQLLQSKAQQRLNKLRANAQTENPVFVLGGTRQRVFEKPVTAIVIN